MQASVTRLFSRKIGTTDEDAKIAGYGRPGIRFLLWRTKVKSLPVSVVVWLPATNKLYPVNKKEYLFPLGFLLIFLFVF